MVPQDPKEIPNAAAESIERLLARLAEDRESIERSGHPEAASGIELVNALARSADDVMKALSADIGAKNRDESK
jgi:hypothetical protein